MKWMIGEIEARGGSVPFDAFMELALYHPVHGYYSGESVRYGRAGDFLTAPTASSWYSRVVARLLTQVAAERGPLRLVDLAAGDGSFLAGVSDALGTRQDAVLAGVAAVERSAAMREKAQERLGRGAFVCVEAVSFLAECSGPTVVHASELYDAMPVARVVVEDDGLYEMWVKVGSDGLEWEHHPARLEVFGYFESHGVELQPGQIAEANLVAVDSHNEHLASAGEDGLALILDYGYEARRLYNPRGRALGSLATFHNHQVGRDPLRSPGEVDLTAHVNWDDLRRSAGASWQEVGLWSLAEFLVRAGIGDELEGRGFGIEAEIDAEVYSQRQEVKRLLDPEGMGSDLKMLVQATREMAETATSVLSFEF